MAEKGKVVTRTSELKIRCRVSFSFSFAREFFWFHSLQYEKMRAVRKICTESTKRDMYSCVMVALFSSIFLLITFFLLSTCRWYSRAEIALAISLLRAYLK